MACPPSLRAGDLRNLFTFQEEVRSDDGAGGYTVSWIDCGLAWGSMKEKHDWEAVRNGALKAGTVFVMRFHFVDANQLTVERHRLVLGERVFNIRGVEDEQELHRVIQVKAEEGVVT